MIDIDTMLGVLIKQDRTGLVEKIKQSALFDDLLEDYTHNDDVRSIEVERDEALDHSEYLLTLSRPLHEAICEGRKEDAIYILREMFDIHFMSAENYARLFPGRVK